MTKEKNALVATVDGFQGGECDAIVLSIVRFSEFAGDAQRLNVALTRARSHLIVLISENQMQLVEKESKKSLLVDLIRSFDPSQTFKL